MIHAFENYIFVQMKHVKLLWKISKHFVLVMKVSVLQPQ